MRHSMKMLGGVMLALAIGACQSAPFTTPISTASVEADRVQAALERWPQAATDGPAIKRPFFATIHVAGRRMTASGVMQYYGPRDFRIIAATEMGTVLFDGRVNWAGVTVLRTGGFDKGMVETLLKDLSLAFDLPGDLSGLGAAKDQFILRKTLGDTHRHTWSFDRPTGLLRSTDVELGALGSDNLRVEYRSYNARGWPEDLVVTRPSRMLNVYFTFTDNNVVQREWRGNTQ